MDGMKDMLAKRLPQAKQNVKIHSDIHALADEISTAFAERKRFAMYLGVIKRVGVPTARRIFRELQQDGKGSGKLFMFLCRKEPKEPQAPPEETNAPPAAAKAPAKKDAPAKEVPAQKL